MKYKVEHINLFEYDSDVEQSLNTIRLKPLNNERQHLLAYNATISPASMVREHVDLWGNNVGTFFIPEKHKYLEVKTESTVSVQRAPFLHRIQYSPEMQTIFHSQHFREHYLPYLISSNYTFISSYQIREVINVIGDIENPVEFSIRLMEYLYNVFTYDNEATNVETTAFDAFNAKRGVCQDYTHVMLGILRAHGIPSRYISGYLFNGDDSNLVGDTATHAWVEIMVPGVGWIGLDPTNNVEVLEHHILLGFGRDYADVIPVEGVYKGGKNRLTVKVNVTHID